MKRIIFLSIFSLFSLCSYSLLAANSAQVSKTIDAEVLDAGDYYLGLDGLPIRFYRKKGIFVSANNIKQSRGRSLKSSKQISNNSSFLNGLGMEELKNHSLGAIAVYRNKNLGKIKKPSFTTQPELIPVFTNSLGDRDSVVLPEILVSFQSSDSATRYKSAIANTFGLRVKYQLMYSKRKFLYIFDTFPGDYSEVFRITRDIMALGYIEWAEPNMLIKLSKTQVVPVAIPNDPEFRDQWSLFNWSKNGELCTADSDEFTRDGISADIDINDAWDIMATIEQSPVIAIIDDGFHLDHPDLQANIISPIVNEDIPFSGNKCASGQRGCDFATFCEQSTVRRYGHAPISEMDNTCALNGETEPTPKEALDGHGTQIAGIAAAVRNNANRISGVALNSKILPIRIDLNKVGAMDCVAISDAFSYAAKHADVISNSWETGPGFKECETAINDILGDVTDESDPSSVKKRGNKGTPVVFSSGNTATGWRKISIDNVPAGTIQLTLHKDSFGGFIDTTSGEDAVWIDDVAIPGISTEPIGTIAPASWEITDGTNTLGGPGNDVYSQCTTTATATATSVSAVGNHAIGGDGHAIKLTTALDSCIRLDIPSANAGTLEFWVWVSTETWNDGNDLSNLGDLFRVYVDGAKVGSDLISRTAENNLSDAIFHDEMAYPASNTDVIAVGASDNGSIHGHEDRAYFSQYGPGIDLVAPGTNILTTSGASSTIRIKGSSASAPMVAATIANMLAVNEGLTLTNIKDYIQKSADQIGPKAGEPFDANNEFTYNAAGSNSFYGHGRLNAYKAVQMSINDDGLTNSLLEAPEICEDPNPGAADNDFLLLMMPAILAGAKKKKNE